MTSKEYEQSLWALESLQDAQRYIRRAAGLLQWEDGRDIASVLEQALEACAQLESSLDEAIKPYESALQRLETQAWHAEAL